MLEMRTRCETCDRELASDQDDVFICSYECTYCAGCAEDRHERTCPNCGGNLVVRPMRALSTHE